MQRCSDAGLVLGAPDGARFGAARVLHRPLRAAGALRNGGWANHAVPGRAKSNAVEVCEIEKIGRKAVDSNLLFIDNLRVPVADRIGEEGRGFEYILHGFNPERILVAAEAVGLGRAALEHAADYAKTRIVFGRPIGRNQAIQHPLAKCWMELEAANLVVFKACLYDAGKPCGAEANAAKYLAFMNSYS